MFENVLIANRGEIAVRIIKACRELGVKSTAVYAQTEADAPHVLLADEAILLGLANPAESYLNAPKLIDAALQAGCDAVHPGYGFLSENAEFAAAVQQAGLTFIGPRPQAIRVMGDKVEARRLMEGAGVPVVPGFDAPGAAEDAFATAAAQIGFPVLVKAAAGGGGKGMRVVETPAALPAALAAARREAHNAFGNDHVYLEKYLTRPRHIEFQILADQHGATVHLFERECSIQRRHQKIIEETPSPFLSRDLRQEMAAAAIAAAEAVVYVNAGTVEFLVDEGQNFYFLEMNTRLQVEHPITEAVTGIDLVQAQLRIAAGEPLSIRQADVMQRGHAIECRVYAEDPANQFLPATGIVRQLVEPSGVGVRIDSGLRVGGEVTVHYDPLLAKVITHAADREATIRKMDRVLGDYAVLGLTTNSAFLRAVITHPAFVSGQTDTGFVETHFTGWSPPPSTPDVALIAAALFDHLQPSRGVVDGSETPPPPDPWQISDSFRLGGGV